MTEASTDTRKPRRMTIWVSVGVTCGLLLVAAANAHLVYVASTSQPPCVVHLRQGDNASQFGRFAAAESSCASPLSALPAHGKE